ncbi:hypothetical protein SBA4_5030007 [Candidatus Sulfopaludibacter sp. SbA4]|nr:hypothetical protein SBA4_5030007 [Candidatus Sulfopaludibacter sp. SbA4]
MSYPGELLELAQYLVRMEGEPPRQAWLRHLLISEATLNWAQVELRPALGRVFEHGTMKSASKNKADALNKYFKGNPPTGAELDVARNLNTVVNAFMEAQQERNHADYNTSRDWTRYDVQILIDSVSAAFESWQAVRDEPVAQAYLVSLFGKERSHG